MKAVIKSLLVFYLATIAILVNAQTTELYQRRIDNYKAMKTVGIVLISAAIPVGVIGTYWIIDGGNKASSNDWGGFFSGSSELMLGLVMDCLAGVSLIGGTVMTIIGNKKMKEFQLKLDGLKVGAYYTPNHSGITLIYQF